MSVPTFLVGVLNTDFNYLSHLAVTDTITILNDLNTQLTALGWTCSVAGASPNAVGTYTSPVRSDGASIKVVATQVSATAVKYVVTDHTGLQVNNATSTQQQIAVAGNEVRLYCNMFGFFVDSIQATPECWGAGILDQTPEAMTVPRANYFATGGPRNNAGTINSQAWEALWVLAPGGTAYALGAAAGSRRAPSVGTFTRTTFTGALMFAPMEMGKGGGDPLLYLLGRVFQALMLDGAQIFGAEFTVPIDVAVTGVFKVIGLATASAARICARKS